MSHYDILKEHMSSYTEPKLYINNFPTGCGKTTTLTRLALSSYQDYFKRIVFLSPRTALVDETYEMLRKQIEKSGEENRVNLDDIIVLRGNVDVARAAIDNGSLEKLLIEIEKFNKKNNPKRKEKRSDDEAENAEINKLKDDYGNLKEALQPDKASGRGKDDGIENLERVFRKQLRAVILSLSRSEHFLKVNVGMKNDKEGTVEQLLSALPSLAKAYPQVEIHKKKIWIMTAQKAIWGIDPIIRDRISFSDLYDKKRTLLVFDESDQCAVEIQKSFLEDQDRPNSVTLLQYYKTLIDARNKSGDFARQLEEVRERIKSRLREAFKQSDIDFYSKIVLRGDGITPSFTYNIMLLGEPTVIDFSSWGNGQHKANPYIIHREGSSEWELFFAANKKEAEEKAGEHTPVSINQFVRLYKSSLSYIHSFATTWITDNCNDAKKRWNEGKESIAGNTTQVGSQIYPTIEKSIRDFLLNWYSDSNGEIYNFYYKDLNAHLTTRKNRQERVGGGRDKIKFPNHNVYTEGIDYFRLDYTPQLSGDKQVANLVSKKMDRTFEALIAEVFEKKSDAQRDTTIIFNSATAGCKSVLGNADLIYIKEQIGEDRFMEVPEEVIRKFNESFHASYPESHKIVASQIAIPNIGRKIGNINYDILSPYREMFSEKAKKWGLFEKWLEITERKVGDKGFEIRLLLQFVEVFYNFLQNKDIKSFLYFQNRLGKKQEEQFHTIANLVEGKFTKDINLDERLDKDLFSKNNKFRNSHIEMTNDADEVTSDIAKRFKRSGERVMLIAAYSSFARGVNFQYDISKGKGTTIQEQDWDAIYVQQPRNYLSIDNTNLKVSDNDLLKLSFAFAKFIERGIMSPSEAKKELHRAISSPKNFLFSGKGADKSEWVANTINQSIGRICRTKNPNHITRIYYDEEIAQFVMASNTDIPKTKEYAMLIESMKNTRTRAKSPMKDSPFSQSENLANIGRMGFDRILRDALYYARNDVQHDDLENEIPMHRIVAQRTYNTLREFFLKHPAIKDDSILYSVRIEFERIFKLYNDWLVDCDGSLLYEEDKNTGTITAEKGLFSNSISEESAGLSAMMKNQDIMDYFTKEGFATHWEGKKYLVPTLLKDTYKGALGEAAFLGLMLKYAGATAKKLYAPIEKEFELADFVLDWPNGAHRIAFDVKNYNPEATPLDKDGDVPSVEKMKYKEERLGCKLIIVSVFRMDSETQNELKIINGLIDNEGNIIQRNIDQLVEYICMEEKEYGKQ